MSLIHHVTSYQWPDIPRLKVVVTNRWLALLILAGINWSAGAESFAGHQDSLNRSRFYFALGTGTLVYGMSTYALHQTWYDDFEKTSFHFFDDWGEWNNMDKAGHAFAAYFQSDITYQIGRWTGLKEKTAIWTATGVSLLFQTTVELFDAHSAKWGFSWSDMAFNLAGTSLFTAQQLGWGEQRIRLKVSSWPAQYSRDDIISSDEAATSSLYNRTNDLFGTGYVERYLKDYNAQTIWLSVNLSSFGKESSLPKWLNISLGYSAENLFGGYSNTWSEDGHTFSANPEQYPRTRQWYLAPDIDFSRIRTRSKFLKTLFSVLNVFKAPTPAIEFNMNGKVKWYWLFL